MIEMCKIVQSFAGSDGSKEIILSEKKVMITFEKYTRITTG